MKSHVCQESPILYLFSLIIIIMPTFILKSVIWDNKLFILSFMRENGRKDSVFP